MSPEVISSPAAVGNWQCVRDRIGEGSMFENSRNAVRVITYKMAQKQDNGFRNALSPKRGLNSRRKIYNSDHHSGHADGCRQVA